MRSIISALSLILAMAIPAVAAPKATIMVRPESNVSAQNVVIGDIATVQSADTALAKRLTGITVSTAPLPGKTRKLMREQVAVGIRKAGFSTDAVELLSPSEFAVTRKAEVVTGQAIFEAAKEFALRQKSLPGTASVETPRVPMDLTVPSGKLALRVSPGTKEVHKGQNSLPVEVVVDDQVYRTVHVTVQVKVLAPILVSTQAISKMGVITQSNVSLETRDITNLPGDALMEPPADGWVASVPIASGAVIRKSWVSAPAAVRSGDSVVVIVQSGGLRVTDKGTAVQDGRPGDRIKVRLQGDVREVTGTVDEPGVVKINIGRGR